MSTLIDGSSVRQVTQGIRVERATATVAADQDLFSIDGGDVLIVGFWGKVTTAIGGGSQDFALHFDPDDGGSNVSICDASTPLAVDGDVVDTFYTINTTFGGDMVATLDYAANGILATPLIFPDGDIVLDVTGTEAGSVEWNLIYVPLEDGATVTAAA